MGKFSRNKGRRGEQQLVLHMAKLGYQAERILRQYQEAGQPDVKAVKNGVVITLENKAKKCSYKTIYDVYYRERDSDGLLCFVPNSGGTAVAMSTNFEQLLKPDRAFRNLLLFPPAKKDAKVFKRIIGLKEEKQEADYLVIKDNNKPRLFIRYWG